MESPDKIYLQIEDDALLLRLEGLLKIPMYKRPKEDDWFITDYTRKQILGSIQNCIDIIKRGNDA